MSRRNVVCLFVYELSFLPSPSVPQPVRKIVAAEISCIPTSGLVFAPPHCGELLLKIDFMAVPTNRDTNGN